MTTSSVPPTTAIPVAPSVPLLGSLPWMALDGAGFLERVGAERGPIVRLPIGPSGMVMLSHPDDLRYVLQDAQKKYVRGRAGDLVRPIFGNGLAMSDPPFWLRQRRIMQPSFSRARIAGMAAAMNDVAGRHIARLRDGEQVDAQRLMLYVARDVILQTMFSEHSTSEMQELDDALAEIDRFIKTRMILPFKIPLSWPLPGNVRVRRATAIFDRILYGIIERRERSGEQHGDLLDALMSARDEETGERMSKKELRDEVMHIFFAGHETSAHTLTFATLALTQHPKLWAEHRDEVDAVLGGRAPGPDDVPRLVRTGMILRETLRLYPPAWIFTREAAEDDVIRGHAIPKGTVIMLAPIAMHRDPSLWPAPRRFDPDRFADDPTAAAAGKTWAYLPFGGGPHVCIGKHFALLEITIVLSRLTQRGRLVALRPDAAKPQGASSLSVRGGLPARFEARRDGSA